MTIDENRSAFDKSSPKPLLKREKIGILGGLFDPVHNGHLHIAQGALEKLGLTRVCLVPASDPPHKQLSPFASGHHRMEMLRIAVNGNPSFEILDIELRRPGKSYTAETLAELNIIYPEWDLHFIIGGDNLSEILTWRNPTEIFRLAQVVLVNRPGFTQEKDEIDLPGEVIQIELPGIDVSSTQIRRRIKEGASCEDILPLGVEEYIRNNQLYL